MRTRVKICGITRFEDAELAVELGASALGFNFYPPSPRYIEPEAAAELVGRVPPFVTCVGVFANEPDAGRVAAAARRACLTAVQLHGARFPARMKALAGYTVIRALALRRGVDFSELADFPAAAWLLDADVIGGTGKTADWELAREAARRVRVILAGGLTPGNVAEGVRVVRPYAVDVASGVESSPGVKDAAKLRGFFDAVEAADLAVREGSSL